MYLLLILKHLIGHLAITLIFGLILFGIYNNIYLILVAIGAGILIDLDHFIDYFYAHGFSFSLKIFFRPLRYVLKSRKVIILAHGWEFTLPLYFLGLYLGRRYNYPGLEWAFVLPYFFHLVWDQLADLKANRWRYFFIYRISHNFSLDFFRGQKTINYLKKHSHL